MEDEGAEWQKAQTQIRLGGQPEDEDQDQDKGKGKAMDEGGGEVKNAGEVTNEDDDDILPSCYVLDISIHGIAPKSLWIRTDYIRIFNFFQAYYDEMAKPMDDAPSAVLTGQPGIGKSFWMFYAARRLLAERRPFIWFYKATYYLFVDDGVHILPPDWRHDDFSCIVWTLVDSDQDRDGVPGTLVPHVTNLFVMYVTSPAVERWSRLGNTKQPIVVIMNPWGRREMQRAARLSRLEGITETHVNEMFDQLGPVARLCIKWTSDQLAQYRNELHQAISKITADDIKKLTIEACGLTMDAVSDKICLLRRQKWDEVFSQAVVAPITDYIKTKLSNQFRKLKRAEQIRLYQFFEKRPELRRTAGIFYEAIIQSRFRKGMHLELVPMVKLEKGEGSKTLPRWYPSHTVLCNPLLEAARQQALGQQISVEIRPKTTVEYTDEGLRSIESNIFYVPALTN
ncbi:hypothetical protein M378DRAFT_11689 [Amanita muscaria Koide BX008]|uniref:Crinkler (CRN) family protein n=1 Tax=Amanita muscaria (strain Koide BX008) TaxID=946122 RepID=A0A0C2X5X3_AMAMK|nr:hypothetical protein M378DRAFT_11689 [Amanita muscaria Koide BX008]